LSAGDPSLGRPRVILEDDDFLRSPGVRWRSMNRLLGIGVAAAIAIIEVANLLVVAPDHHDAGTVALLVASAVPIAFWRRFPFAVSLVTGAVTIVLAALDMPHLGLAVLAAVFAVALWGSPQGRKAAMALLLVGVPVVPLLTDDAASIPKNIAFYAAAWIFGALLRERRVYTQVLEQRMRELEREREEKAALAAEAERSRIARELHDVLTHSVSVMVIQAQAAQAAAGDEEQVAGALARIESVGKESLVELRRLLQRLRTDDESLLHGPTPGLAQLDELLGEVRAAGLDVSLALDGEARPLPASVDLSAYRIVQEALTNTLRHAGNVATQVVLRYRPDEFTLEVLDDGRAQPGQAGTGHGLAGMRERVALVGGTLVAEDLPGGGFRVAARMPLQAGP
jgi:signal transduction histidine kinase